MKNATILLKQNPILIVILCIALFLRLYNLDYMEFKGDESFNSFRALNIKSMPLTGSIGTTGMNEPPVFIYLLSIPYLFSKNPVVAAAFIAFLNVFAILLCYLAVSKFYNKDAAIIASAFYAVSPWQMLFSRKIWAQDLLAPFAVLFLYFLLHALHTKNKHYIIYALIALGLLIQIHLSALYFLFLAIIIFAVYWSNLNKKCFIMGITLFLLTFAPYALFQINNYFVDAQTLLELRNKNTPFHFSSFVMPFTLVSTKGFGQLLGTDMDKFENNLLKINFLDTLSMSLLFLSFLFLLAYPKKYQVLLLWLIAGTIFLAFSKVDSISTHYFASFFPLYFIIVGNTLSLFIKAFNGIGKYFIWVVILIVLSYQMIFDLNLLRFIGSNECINGEYGMPYRYRLENVKNVADDKITDVNQITKLSCNCAKCDIMATQFMLETLENSD